MIDVRIGPAQSPARRVSRKVFLHVFVEIFLQVGPALAKGSHDHIGTNAGFDWHVAVRIFELLVRSIVTGRLADLIDRGVDDEFEIRRTVGGKCASLSLLLRWLQWLRGVLFLAR